MSSRCPCAAFMYSSGDGRYVRNGVRCFKGGLDVADVEESGQDLTTGAGSAKGDAAVATPTGDNLIKKPDGADAMAEGLALLREALEGSREVLGPTHLNTLITSANLGALLRDHTEVASELKEAEALVQAAIDGLQVASSNGREAHPHVQYVRRGLEELDS